MSRYSDLVLSQGATNHWSLDEAADATTAIDSIGGVNLSINGAPGRGLAVVNGGMSFAASKYLGATATAAMPFDNTLPFSYSFIMRRDSLIAASGVVSRRTNGTTSRTFGCFFYNANPVVANALVIDFGESQARWNTTFLPTIGTYYHVAIVYSPTGPTFTVYVNGEFYASTTLGIAPTSQPGTANFRIGCLGGGEASQNFSGLIDEVVVFTAVELTPDQVRAQYATAFPIMRVFNGSTWSDADKRVIT